MVYVPVNLYNLLKLRGQCWLPQNHIYQQQVSDRSITSKSYRSFLKDDKLGGICITVQTSSRNIINLLFIDLISSLLNIQLTLEVIILHVIAFEPQHICSFNNINLTHWSSGTKCTIMIILLFICRFLHQY